MTVLRPRTLTEALAVIADGAQPVAGGTALQAQWAQGLPRPGQMVDLMPLLPAGITPDLSQQSGPLLRIGAATTLQTLAKADIPLMSEAARRIAAPGVRRLATLGGQIGWRQGCLLPVLLVLDTQLITTSGEVALADWLARPEGIILDICLTPRPGFFRKIGPRAAFTPAHLVVAGTVAPLRLALGGGPVPPQRLHTAERLIDPARPEDIPDIIAANATLPTCPHRSAFWRAEAAGRITADALQAGGKDPAPPVLPTGIEADRNRWHIRPDMAEKVTGQLDYLTDARRPGMLVGRILRSAHPHARLLKIDTQKARAMPGVRAVVTASDIPGQNAFGIVFPDQPALAHDRVRYLGDAIAAVAAETEAQAEAALDQIEITYEPLPPVSLDNAAGALPMHGETNLITTVGLTRGDVAAGFAAAAHVVEDTYLTPRQMHGFMETEGGHAEVLPDGTLLVSAGGQHGARDRMQLARILARPESTIRVITSPTGGAFGGKDELTVQPALALLALATGQPVRLHLTRAESVLSGTKRNPFRIKMRTACDAEGHLIAQEVEVLAEAGAYASLSPGVLETAMEHAAGPYDIPNVQTRGRLYYTNNSTCGAFRGFGANQMAYAVECQIDRLAALTRLSPVEIRRRNLRQPGAPGFLGQRVAPSERLAEMLEAAGTSPLWTPAEAVGEWRCGTGMGLIWQGNGLGTIPTDEAEGKIRFAPDGAIEVLCGMDEMGQGLLAGLVASTADALGVAREDIRPVTGDTGITPDSGSTTASRGGYVMWKIATEAAPGFAAQMLKGAAALLGTKAQNLRLIPGGVAVAAQNSDTPLITFADLAAGLYPSGLPAQTVAFGFPKTNYTKGNARFIFCAGATVARVKVSRLTGEVRVTAIDLHTAAGPIIDLASYLGQMEGGLVQGLGFTLSEDVLMEGGQYLTRNLDSYMMPGIRDVPDAMRVTALESLDPGDPYGPRGAGELGIGGITPAICNAVAAATGLWPTTTPIPPEMILRGVR